MLKEKFNTFLEHSQAQQLEAKIKSLSRSEKISLISEPKTINQVDKLSALTKENKLTAIKLSEFTNSLQSTPPDFRAWI